MAGYVKEVLLGSGSYGEAWVVESLACRKKFVMKEVILRHLDSKNVTQALNEVEALSGCKHENVIGYSEAFVEKGLLFIVMEYASGGDLQQCITRRNGLYFQNKTVFKWLGQLVSAMEYIHSKGILHRDIKPQNLFLTSCEDLKLGDFGICRIFQDKNDVASTFIGTPFYLSPEICRQECYDQKSDMWAVGCVLYQLCALHVPFTADSLSALLTAIERGRFQPLPLHCDPVLTSLVDYMLTPDPRHRPTASQVLDLLSNKKHVAERKRVHRQSPIDSTTYTIHPHRPPKVPRMSPASPELSAMLERQRSLSLRSPRAFSADAVRPARQSKKIAAPKMNLMEEIPNEKKLIKGSSENFLEPVNRAMFELVTCDASVKDSALIALQDRIQETMGTFSVNAIKKAVETGQTFDNTWAKFEGKEDKVLPILSLLALEEKRKLCS